MTYQIDHGVEAGSWPPEPVLQRTVEAASDAVVKGIPTTAHQGEVSVLFTDDEHIAALNQRWRGKSGPTNVLSFPAAGPRSQHEKAAQLGDIVLGFETVTKEAAEAGLTLVDHITHLLVHGLLHLLGYDHEEEQAAEAMETLETEILATLGIANPYADNVSDPSHDGRNI